MPRQNLNPANLPHTVTEAVQRLGKGIAVARVRRGLRHADLAAKTGLAVGTLRRLEQGHPTTAIGAYFAALWAMGLDREFGDLASPDRDEEGKALERTRLPTRVTRGRRGALDADF